MDKLQALLEEFRNDKSWNTENRDGSHRFDQEIAWIEEMVKQYSEKLGLSIDKTIELMEAKRNYSWPNYYQPCNFPSLEGMNIVGIYASVEAFQNHAKQHYKGFKCGACGNFGLNPQECDHRVAKDGICNWTSYGLFGSGIYVVILEIGVKPIQIFQPVNKEEVA